jgi:hypothetical protein
MRTSDLFQRSECVYFPSYDVRRTSHSCTVGNCAVWGTPFYPNRPLIFIVVWIPRHWAVADVEFNMPSLPVLRSTLFCRNTLMGCCIESSSSSSFIAGFSTSGPRAVCDPPMCFVRPACCFGNTVSPVWSRIVTWYQKTCFVMSVFGGIYRCNFQFNEERQIKN